MSRLFIFLIVVVIFSACEAPTAKYLQKEGGIWNIDELHYSDANIDTVFLNCGEMTCLFNKDLEGKKNKDWEIEGTIVEVASSNINGYNEWLWTAWHFFGDTRDHFLAAGNTIDITIGNLKEVMVRDRTSNKMVWEYSDTYAGGNRIYYFSRK